MEDFLYPYNKPVVNGKYDLILDGKVVANEIVFKNLSSQNKNENVNLVDKIKDIESKLQNRFTFETVTELPTEGKESVIYLVPNGDTSGDENSYDEYLWDKTNSKFELIGSGSYEHLKSEIDKRVVINNPITITEGNNTTSITSDTISTTTLTGTLDAESMKNSLTAEAVQAVLPIAWSEFTVAPAGANYERVLAIGNDASGGNRDSLAVGDSAKTIGWNSVAIGGGATASTNGTALGAGCYAGSGSVGIGQYHETKGSYAVGIGGSVRNVGNNAVSVGLASSAASQATAVGYKAASSSAQSVTIGALMAQSIEGQNVESTCTTQGTGSITIGAGANTKNPLNPDNKTPYKNSDGEEVESSYSITIGQKAENYSPQNVVIGANAKATNSTKTVNGVEETVLTSNSVTIGYDANNTGSDSVVIGAQSVNNYGSNVLIGASSKSTSISAVAVGFNSECGYLGVSVGKDSKTATQGVALGTSASADGQGSVSIGWASKVKAKWATAIGSYATVSDQGATVIRSTAADGTYTQFYFSGQNTPLALKYYPTEWEKKQDVDDQGNPKVDENGEPVMVDDKDKPTKGQAMMGYVVTKEVTEIVDGKEVKKKEILECGTNLLAALFPNHGLGDNPFQPTTTAIDGEIISFHPSDIDMPIEDTNDNVEEDYKPLPLSPIYPIVVPTIDEISN